MLRVAEQYAGTDTGRQRRANEDSLLARSPLFVVADGMGGAQAGEVASRIAVESFRHGLDDAAEPERARDD
jgi:serine/threonine protein phosphatase PrpC